jgi:hypothetical protein
MSLHRTTKALPGKCVDCSETANIAHCPKTAWIFRNYGKRHSFAIARLPDSRVAVPLPMGGRERSTGTHSTLPERDRDVVVEPPVDYRIIVIGHQTPTPSQTPRRCRLSTRWTVKLQGSFSPRQHLIAKLLTPTPSMMIVAKNAACQITSLIT